MEAADDLAYCMSDIEDGIEKGIITGAQIDRKIKSSNVKFLNNIYKVKVKFRLSMKDQKVEDLRIFLQIKTSITRELVALLARVYKSQITKIIKSSTISLVDSCDEANDTLNVFRDLANDYLYNSRKVRENEIIANRVLTGILDTYMPLLLANKSRFDSIKRLKYVDGDKKAISVEQALFLQLAKKFVKVYENDLKDVDHIEDHIIREWIIRAHLLVDQVSGMTDKFALAKFRLLCTP
jgi:dGTPase